MAVANRRVYAITLRKAHMLMLREGFDAAALLANTELTEADLEQPYHLISWEQARMYYLNVVNLARRDGIGLQIGWTTALSDMGPHGMVLLTEQTVREALLKTWELRDNYNLLVDWSYDITDNYLVHRAAVHEPNEQLRIFLLERGLATIQAHTEELVGSQLKPVRVLFDYKTPGNVDQYKEIFRCPMRFSQGATELIYQVSWLDHKLERPDAQARDVLDALRSNLHEKLASGGDIVQDVKMALRATPGQYPSLERIADSLAMSSRTLRRKLGQHNVRYQDLLDEERSRVATDFLRNSTLTIQQIADRCGFADAQNFSQAFRRWHGVSPTQYRKSAQPD